MATNDTQLGPKVNSNEASHLDNAQLDNLSLNRPEDTASVPAEVAAELRSQFSKEDLKKEGLDLTALEEQQILVPQLSAQAEIITSQQPEEDLSSTSFSFNTQRVAKTNLDKERAHKLLNTGRSSAEKQQNKTSANSSAKNISRGAFAGKTILDKLVSFLVHIMKVVERNLLPAFIKKDTQATVQPVSAKKARRPINSEEEDQVDDFTDNKPDK